MDEKSSETKYLQKSAATSLPDGFVPTLNVSGAPELFEETKQKAKTSSSTDSEISGYAVSFEWDFSTSSENLWAAQTFALSLSNSDLANASEFQMAFKNVSEIDVDFRAFLQLGVETSSKFESVEEKTKIPTWEITNEIKNAKTFRDGTISLVFSDSQRAAISRAGGKGARLIVVGKSGSGAILAGPHKASAVSFAISRADESAKIASFEEREKIDFSDAKKLCAKNNSVQVFSATFDESAKDSTIGAVRFFEKSALKDYEFLKFFAKIATDKKNAPSTLGEAADFPLEFFVESADGKTGASASISYDSVQKIADGSWHEIALSLSSGQLLIDGATVYAKTSVENTGEGFSKFTNVWNPLCKNQTYFKELRIDELHLSDYSGHFSARSRSTAKWKMQESHGILKEAEARGTADFSTSHSFFDGANEKSALVDGFFGATISSIRSEFSAAGNGALSSASHLVKTQNPFLGIFGASESFSFVLDSSATTEKIVKIAGKSASFLAQTNAKADLWSKSQKAKTQVDFEFFGVKSKTQVDFSQSISSKSEIDSWLEGVKKANALAFSTGEADATKRDVALNTNLSGAVWKIKPELSAQSGGTRTVSAKTFSDSSFVSVLFPFSFEKSSFSFKWKKSAGGVKSSSVSSDYKDDLWDLAGVLDERDWFLKAFPVNDLASSSLSSSVLKSAGSGESAFFSTLYEANWKRSFSASAADFFVPKTATLSFSRDIRAATSVSDLYQIKVKTGSTSMNIFGKRGIIPFFDWYEQDEFSTSVSIAAKIPRKSPSEWTWQASGYVQATFLIREGNELKTGIEGSFSGTEDWSAKATAVWKRNGKSAFLDGAIGIFWRAGREKSRKHTRKDSFNFSASNSSSTTSSTRKYSAEYSHEIDSELSKYITLNTALGLNYKCVWEKSASLEATALLGVTIKF